LRKTRLSIGYPPVQIVGVKARANQTDLCNIHPFSHPVLVVPVHYMPSTVGTSEPSVSAELDW